MSTDSTSRPPQIKKHSLLKKILLGVISLILLLVIIVALQPEDFKISRSMSMDASPEKIFPQVNDLTLFNGWSPWAKLDPDQKLTISDPSSGVGASHAWKGNSSVGEGKMTIVESLTNERVGMKLEFIRPFQCNNDVEFTFNPNGDQTEVTWTMTGKNNFMAKLMGLLMNMDKMVGGQFEEGLTNMKKIVESSTAEK
ncbi:MAG: SRPBCC family protein [Planctomycetaceae bacterium]|nr:SRPBCC family protein [Planctomycetaceae bacterium]